MAKKLTKTTEIHGETLADDYFWMREKSNPEVTSYLEAENAYTAAAMAGTRDFQAALYAEMLGRIKETDLSVPYRNGKFVYYTRTEKGKQYPIFCRKPVAGKADEQVILDVNELAKGEAFMSIGDFEVSDDGNLLAYSTDNTGFRQYTLRVKDLRTGVTLPDRIEKTSSVTWAGDNKTLFYVVEDHAKRPYRFYRHVLGGTEDTLVYEEKDELYRIFANRTRSRAYILLTSASATTSEVRFLDANTPAEEPKLILAREGEHEYYVDHRGDSFYIRTNSNALNYRIVTAPVSDPQKKNWKGLIAHRADVMLDDIDLFANHLVVHERQNGLEKIHVLELRNMKEHVIEFPEPVYSVFGDNNKVFATTTLRFRYQSYVTPMSVFDYDMDKREKTLLKETEVLGGYDRTKYVSERIFATAADGTKVPVSLLYVKGTKLDGTAPLLLYGYGAYGYPVPVGFSSNRFSLVDRGVIYASAHIRGGGDLGKAWHDGGKMMVKKNTFTDFIAAAEHLVNAKYTASDRMVIQGGSAGGLLVGAVTNMRPDLFKAVVAQVPFVDVMNTMLDTSLPLTVGEYLEWGNPNKKPEYDYMKTYCPYTNIAKMRYPAMLVKTSFNDSQVMYWEAAKYVAKLRANKTDENPLLLKVNMAAGHGGASGRYDALREIAFDYAFILGQMGISK
ncbi:MAG: S9 family peptidase [Thermoanaerobaculia bacterium]